MNLEDYARINRILGYYSRVPGIKIFNLNNERIVFESFKKDIELFNSTGGFNEVERVLVYRDFVAIQLKDNSTPVVYYFANDFCNLKNTIGDFKSICDESHVRFEEMDINLIQ